MKEHDAANFLPGPPEGRRDRRVFSGTVPDAPFRTPRRDRHRILPLVHMKSRIFGISSSPCPISITAAFALTEDLSKKMLLEEGIGLRRPSMPDIRIRQEASLKQGFEEKKLKVSMRLGLPADPKDLWKSFPSKLRSQVKVPQKAGMVPGSAVWRSWTVFTKSSPGTCGTSGPPSTQSVLFAGSSRPFREHMDLLRRLGNAVVASGFLAGFKDRLEIPWASSIRDITGRANMLLYWSCLLSDAKKGFARSTSPVHERGEHLPFKQQWGRRNTDGLELLGEDGQGLRRRSPRATASTAFDSPYGKKLPLPLTRANGPRIVRTSRESSNDSPAASPITSGTW